MSNSAQGVVLPNQPVAVRAGAGLTIDSAGIISINSSDPTFNGFVKTNNASAFNAYVWPGVDGTADQFLQTDGAGNLTWADAAGFAVVTVDSNPPTPPDEGELWYDCNTGYLKVYQNCVAPGGWTNVSEPGKPVLPSNTSAFPNFTGGNGTLATPYDCTVTTAAVGSSVFIINTVTITGLAPYQYVPIIDLNAVINGGRFSFSNYYANAGGTLIFQTIFKDQPASPPLTSYTAAIKVGYGTVYIDAVVNLVTPVSLTSPGTISGTPEVGATLTYTPGTAVNGVAPYSYAWEWRKLSDGTSVLSGSGTAPQTYVVPTSLIGDNLYVELTVTDNIGDTDSGVTSLVPTPPATIQKGPFPATTVNFPTTIPGTANTTWNEAGTTSISSNGCLRFSVNGSPFGQGPTNITLNDTLTTEWIVSPACGGANSGTTIQGCLFSANYEECSSFAINRIPGTFPAFTPNTGVARNAVSTSNTVTPTDYNSTAYVTRGAASTGTVIEGSIDGGTNWAAIPASGTTFPINPGQTLTVRQTVGNTLNTGYTAIINIGDSTGTTSQTFTATTVITAPITGAAAPTSIPGTASFSWADAPATLTAGGCIEFSINAGANWVTSASVTNAPPTAVLTRWVNTPTSGTCGDTPGNTTISGTLTSSTGETNTFNLAMNRTPGAFTLSTNTETTTPNTVTSTNPSFTLAGSNSPSYIWGAVTGGGNTPEYSVSGTGGPWLAMPAAPGTATVNPGATVHIRFTTGAAVGTDVLSVNVGASTTPGEFQSGAFTVTVAAAPFPNLPAALLTGPTEIPQVVSATWADGPVPSLTSTGCIEISLDGSTWGQGPLSVTNTSTLYMQWDPVGAACGGAASGTPISGTITNGVYTNSYSLTLNRNPTASPNPISPITGQALSTTATSSNVTLSASNAPAYLTYTATAPSPGIEPLTNLFVAINSGAFVAVPTSGTSLSVPPGATLQFQGDVAGANSTAYTTTFNLGTTTLPWSVTTTAATPTITAPNVFTPGLGSLNVGTPSGITLTGDPYVPNNGAGVHTSSVWEVYKNGYPLTSTNNITAVGTGSGSWQQVSNGRGSGVINKAYTIDGVNWIQAVLESGFVWFYTSSDGGSTWSALTNPVSGMPATSFSGGGVSSNLIWFSYGSTQMMYSFDKGVTYKDATPPPGGTGGISPYTGLAWDGASTMVVVGYQGIAYSTNKGTSWSPVVSSPVGYFGGYYKPAILYNNGCFIAVRPTTSTGSSINGAIYRSTDGANWTTVYSQAGGLNNIAYVGGNVWAAGSTETGVSGRIHISTDNGVNWSPATATGGDLSVGTIVYSQGNGDIVVLTQYSGTYGAKVSTDNGLTWATVPYPIPAAGGLYASSPYAFFSGDLGYYSTDLAGTSILTIAGCQTDGFLVGDTVISDPSGAGPAKITAVSNASVTVYPASALWSNQKIKRDPASYGQITGSPFNISTAPLESLTIAKPPLEAYTKYWARVKYAAAAALPATSDFGAWSDFTTGSLILNPTTFTAASGTGTDNVKAMVNVTGNNFLATTSSGIYNSSDGGASWTKNTDPAISSFNFNIGGSFRTTVATNGSVVIVTALGTTGVYYRSTDGGLTWVSQNMPAGLGAYPIAFAYGGGVFMAWSGPSIYTSSTGASGSWTVQYTPGADPFTNVTNLWYVNNAWFAGLDQTGNVILYRSTDNGVNWTQVFTTGATGTLWHMTYDATNSKYLLSTTGGAYFSAGAGQLYTSGDGITWSLKSTIDATASTFFYLAASGGSIVSTINNNSTIRVSLDGGSTWSNVSVPATSGKNFVVSGTNRYVLATAMGSQASYSVG